MSLVECLGCHHKSFLFCCYQQPANFYALCQACILEASFEEECQSCHANISRTVLTKKEAMKRERRDVRQLMARNNQAQIQMDMQLLNLNHPQGHLHQDLHQSRQSGYY